MLLINQVAVQILIHMRINYEINKKKGGLL